MRERPERPSYILNGGGGDILGLLGIAFIVLRLCEVIDWPWIWVLTPFWAPAAFFLFVVLLIFVFPVAHWGIQKLVSFFSKSPK